MALAADVRLLPGVRANVTMQVPRIHEKLSAAAAAVWLLSSVAILVLKKFSWGVEGLPTLVTCEAELRGVGAFVLFKVAQVVKAFATDVTQMRPFSRVHHFVSLHISRRSEPFATELTDVGLLP